MTRGVAPPRRAARPAVARCGGLVLALVAAPAAGAAAPLVTEAEVSVTFLSATSCAVTLTLGVEAEAVEHRIGVAEGADIGRPDIVGARRVGETKDVGRTRLLVVEPEADRYSLTYRVTHAPDRRGHCPLWIPTIPTAGRGRVVRVTARIPPGSTVRGTLPSFEWAADEGTAAISHLPAFVRVPFALPGEPAPWNVARIMDSIAVVTLLAATAAWTRRRGRAP